MSLLKDVTAVWLDLWDMFLGHEPELPPRRPGRKAGDLTLLLESEEIVEAVALFARSKGCEPIPGENRLRLHTTASRFWIEIDVKAIPRPRDPAPPDSPPK